MDSLSDIRRIVGEVTAPRSVEHKAGPPDGRAASPDPRAGASGGAEEIQRGGDRSVQAAIARASRALGALDPAITGDVGARLGEVREALTRVAAAGDSRAAALLERLDALVFSPGKDGAAALVALTQDGMLARQLALLAAAAVGGVDGPAVAQDVLLARLLAVIGAGPADSANLSAALSASLAELLADAKAQALLPTNAAAQLRSLRAELLTGMAARMRRTGATAIADSLLAVAQDPVSRPGLDGALARVLFTAGRGGQQAARAHAFLDRLLAGALVSAADVAGAFVAESGRGDASLRGALGQYMAAREFEHSWNVARREFGDPLAFGFAVPDGETSFATVQLVGGDEEKNDNRKGGGGTGSFHLTLGVDFSALGPIRADMAVRDDQIALRLVVSDPQIAMEIRRRLRELETVLGSEGRRVLIAVADGTEAQATVDARRVGLHDEDHVMDLEG